MLRRFERRDIEQYQEIKLMRNLDEVLSGKVFATKEMLDAYHNKHGEAHKRRDGDHY
jgi:hypothetical protein